MTYPTTATELTDGVPPDVDAGSTPTGDATYPLDDWARATAAEVEAIAGDLITARGASASIAARLTAIDTADAAKVTKALYDANTILYATTDDTPVALTVGASTVVGRKSSGNIVALTATELGNIIQGGAYTSYTPTLTAVTTNPTMGSGSTATGYYKQVGRRVWGYANIAFGTSAAAGSGAYGVLLPVEPANRNMPIGIGYILDYSDNIRPLVAAVAVSTAHFASSAKKAIIINSQLVTDGFGDGNAPVSNSTPWTWADNDSVLVQFDYEAAADA